MSSSPKPRLTHLRTAGWKNLNTGSFEALPSSKRLPFFRATASANTTVGGNTSPSKSYDCNADHAAARRSRGGASDKGFFEHASALGSRMAAMLPTRLAGTRSGVKRLKPPPISLRDTGKKLSGRASLGPDDEYTLAATVQAKGKSGSEKGVAPPIKRLTVEIDEVVVPERVTSSSRGTPSSSTSGGLFPHFPPISAIRADSLWSLNHDHWQAVGLGNGKLSHQDFMAECKKDAQRQAEACDMVVEKAQKALEFYHKSGECSPTDPDDTLTLFEGSHLSCTVKRYVLRMMKYARCSMCNIVIGFIYLERIKRDYPVLMLSPTNLQRLLLTAVMVASKQFDDIYYSNKHWADVGELSTAAVNTLELKFLGLLNFACNVQREEYDSYISALPTSPMIISGPQSSLLIHQSLTCHSSPLTFSSFHIKTRLHISPTSVDPVGSPISCLSFASQGSFNLRNRTDSLSISNFSSPAGSFHSPKSVHSTDNDDGSVGRDGAPMAIHVKSHVSRFRAGVGRFPNLRSSVQRTLAETMSPPMMSPMGLDSMSAAQE